MFLCHDYVFLLSVSGDLTDAKDKGQIFSVQYEEEWKRYQQIMSSPYLTDVTVIDMKGNHGNLVLLVMIILTFCDRCF